MPIPKTDSHNSAYSQPSPEAGNHEAKQSDAQLIKSAFAKFIAARMELAGLEAKEAAGFLTRKIVVGAAAGICALFCWALMMVAITGGLARWADTQIAGKLPLTGWVSVVIGLAALHGLLGIILLLCLKKKPASPLFELTKQEIKHDKAWVKNKS